MRGGIVDCFAATADAPVRIEFFGDAIESMRDVRDRVAAQQRRRSSGSTSRRGPTISTSAATLFDYLPADATVVLEEPATIAATARALDEERARERHTLLADDEAADDAARASVPRRPRR